MKKKWVWTIIVIAIAAFSIFLFVQSKPTDQDLTGASMGVQSLSFAVTREDISTSIEVKGKTSYADEAWIYAPFSSTVKQWHVEEGQSVTAGAMLFELDSDKLRNEIALTEAEISKQQLMSKINEVSASEQSLETMESGEQQAFNRFAKNEEARLQKQLDDIQLKVSELGLSDMRSRIKQSTYTSPKSGIFLFAENKRPKSVIEDAALGKVVDLTSLQLLSTVTEYDIFRIKEGMEVDIRVDARREMKVKGIVEHVSKFAKTSTEQGAAAAQFELRISLGQSNELIAGLSLTGKIITASKQATLVVPTLAVMRENEQYYVYTSTPAGVDKKFIKIGIETAEKTEVLEGLSEGDSIVLQ